MTVNRISPKPILEGIDLFCGAGGTTEGIEQARINGDRIARVTACVNHDPVAIESHKANHNDVIHFVEDIRQLNTDFLPARDPDIPFSYLWASLECTNFSNAKGGQSRDADSRTLANDLFRYVRAYDPDYIMIENVREFMAWGPLRIKRAKAHNGEFPNSELAINEKKGEYVMIPENRKKGQDYLKWLKRMKSFGYAYEFRLLNAADFGAYTARIRYFGCFAKVGLPIRWPQPTHAKKPVGHLKPWKKVRDVLNLEEHGRSIFGRKKDLSENTLKRIYAGLVRYVGGGNESFLQQHYSGNPRSMVRSVDRPAGSMTTTDSHSLVQTEFLTQYNGGGHDQRTYSPYRPLTTVSTNGRHSLVQPCFLTQPHGGDPSKMNYLTDRPARTMPTGYTDSMVVPQFLARYHGNGGQWSSLSSPSPTIPTKDSVSMVQVQYLDKCYTGSANHQDINKPGPSLTTKDKHSLVTTQFIHKHYGSDRNHQSIQAPAGTVTQNPKFDLVTVSPWLMDTNFNNVGKSVDEVGPTILSCRKQHYLINPQYNYEVGRSIDDPCFTLIARMDKAPPHLVTVESGAVAIAIYDTDSEYTRKIKLFMAAYGIVDVYMRMLSIPELKRIQGFPEEYVLKGTQADQKKFIGNAVVKHIPEVWFEAMGRALIEYRQKRMTA